MAGSFNDNQWQRLVEAAPLIALSVAASAGSARQSVAELDAFLRLVDETADQAGEGRTLGLLGRDVRARLASGAVEPDPEDAIPDGIQAAREAGAVLAVHHDEQEAREIRQWLMRVAHDVASAAREGGVLGIGSRQMSEMESQTMNEIADGLGASIEPDAEAQPDLDASDTEQQGAETEPDVGPDGQAIGPDNIREGNVRGTMAPPGAQEGQGQGG